MFLNRLPASIAAILPPREDFHPYPTARASDRSAWEKLPLDVCAQIVKLADEAETGPDAPSRWTVLPATVYMQFRENGNRTNYEHLHFMRRKVLWQLALGACAAGEGKYLRALADALWAMCEETTWCLPAHNIVSRMPDAALPDADEPVVDLFAAETGALLAWVLYLLDEPLRQLCPLLQQRVQREIERRINRPFLMRWDFWWMGECGRNVNNWNPWILSNCLSTLLLCETNEDDRRMGFVKCLRLLEHFTDIYHPDGGCDEGPSYWGRAGASLFDCLDIVLRATNGKLNYFDEPLVQEIGRFIARVHIAGDRYVNFADAPAVVHPPYDVVMRYGQMIGDDVLSAQGAYVQKQLKALYDGSATPMRVLPSLFNPAAPKTAAAPLLLQTYLPDIEVLCAREQAACEKGFYLAAKGGHNAESHNHNDVGNVIVALDGDTILCDAGVGVYTRFTFSADRYKIWTMRSSYHNLPDIGAYEQLPGMTFCSSGASGTLTDGSAQIRLCIQDAYDPKAGLVRWQRDARLDRASQAITLEDEWTLAAPQDVVMNLISPHKPEPEAGGCILGAARLAFAGALSVEEIDIADARLEDSWPQGKLYRLRIALGNAATGSWKLTITRKG